MKQIQKYEEFYQIFDQYEAGEITEEEAAKRLKAFREIQRKQFEETNARTN